MNDIDEIGRSDGPGRVGGLAGPGGGAASSAAQRALERLRASIISLELPPNTVLSRAALAREFDISQTPLREALQRLEAEGLVNVYPQSRTVVTRLVTAEIQEAQFLRVAVETEAMRRLAPDCPPAVLRRLDTNLAMQEAVAGNPDERGAFQALDEAFHHTMLAAVGQAGLHGLLRSRTGHLDRLRRLDLPGPGKIARIIRDHRGIVAALAAHDPDAAEQAMRAHLSQTISRLDELRAQHPDYFA